MINKRIKIRGAIGIKKGLGLDEIEIDFTGKTGLVALSGPNGKGKTTVLELMSIFRTLASRKGSLKNHFCLRDSYVEQDFIYNGDEYRITWKIDSGSDRQEAFIMVNGESIVNGKVTEYDRHIIENFGSQNLFYNSVFCAQGSGNMSDMTTGKIKELFVEFLRIERLADYETVCKGHIKDFIREKDILDSDIARLVESSSGIDLVETDIEKARKTIESKRLVSIEISNKISTATTTYNQLIEKKAKQSGFIDQVSSLEKQLISLISGRDKIFIDIRDIDSEKVKKILGVKSELERLNSILVMSDSILAAKVRLDSETKLERFFSDCMACAIDEQTIHNNEMGRIREKKVDVILKEISDIKDNNILPVLVSDKSKIDGGLIFLESKKNVLSKSLDDAGESFELVRLDHRIESAQEDIATTIDPACVSTICPALISIEHSKMILPDLEKEKKGILADIEIKKDEINAELAIIEARIIVGVAKKDENLELIEKETVKNKLALEDADGRLIIADLELKKASSLWMQTNDIMGFYRDAAKDCRENIKVLYQLADRAGEIDIATTRKDDLEATMSGINSDYEDRKFDLDSRFKESVENISSFESDIEKLKVEINPLLDMIMLDEKKGIDSLTGAKEGIEWDINIFDKKLAVLSENLIRLEKDKDRLTVQESELKTVKKEIEEWSYLRDACGKNGLQALEIDGAAPLITTEANTILADAFGLDNQIKIVTQDPETGKEVFWIKVIRDDGSEDDFGNLSGGQKVWIAKALSLGMTLVSKRKSGRDFKTLFADEEDGALDDEKALDFIQLYRAMMKTGDFETCFFISHNPNVVAMADHVIDFGKMGD